MEQEIALAQADVIPPKTIQACNISRFDTANHILNLHQIVFLDEPGDLETGTPETSTPPSAAGDHQDEDQPPPLCHCECNSTCCCICCWECMFCCAQCNMYIKKYWCYIVFLVGALILVINGVILNQQFK
jgi:hypothetical protein